MRLISPSALAVALVLASATGHALEAAGSPPLDGSVVRGVVVKVKGGRVTLRHDDGRSQTYSSMPGTVKEGQRVQASTRRYGDSVRLERIEIQR